MFKVLEICRLWYEYAQINDGVSLIDSSVLKCLIKMNRYKKQTTCIVAVVQYSNSLWERVRGSLQPPLFEI